MNYYKVFYWITRADDIKDFFDSFSNIFMFLSVILILGVLVCHLIANLDKLETVDGEDKAVMEIAKGWRAKLGKYFWISFITTMILWGGYVFMPTKKDAITIVAGGAIGSFIASDSSIKAIPSELTLLVRERLKSEIIEAKSSLSSEITDTLTNKTKEELIELLKKK